MFQYCYNRKNFHIYKFKKCLNIEYIKNGAINNVFNSTFYLEYAFPKRSYMFISSAFDKFHI